MERLGERGGREGLRDCACVWKGGGTGGILGVGVGGARVWIQGRGRDKVRYVMHY